MKKRTIRPRDVSKKSARVAIKKDRFKELLAVGFNECILRALTSAFAVASSKRRHALAGMTKRQVIGLAERICRVVSEIGRVNDEIASASGRSLSEVPGARLPVELGLYAAWLLVISKTPLEHRASDRQLIELLLLASARKFTGEPHYAALSELLTEASGEDVSPESLLQLAIDHESQIKGMEDQLDAILATLLMGSSG